VHPGGIQTELGRHIDQSRIQAIIDQMNQQLANRGQGAFPVEEHFLKEPQHQCGPA